LRVAKRRQRVAAGVSPQIDLEQEESRDAAIAITSAAAASRLKFRFDSDPWADAHGYVLSLLRG